ncbi:hypothetical protein C8R43DRAFT_948613 [Mycena crocata]|nr:hypothetical protein C8R43DRAFT_948613 [Mycena crocata]
MYHVVFGSATRVPSRFWPIPGFSGSIPEHLGSISDHSALRGLSVLNKVRFWDSLQDGDSEGYSTRGLSSYYGQPKIKISSQININSSLLRNPQKGGKVYSSYKHNSTAFIQLWITNGDKCETGALNPPRPPGLAGRLQPMVVELFVYRGFGNGSGRLLVQLPGGLGLNRVIRARRLAACTQEAGCQLAPGAQRYYVVLSRWLSAFKGLMYHSEENHFHACFVHALSPVLVIICFQRCQNQWTVKIIIGKLGGTAGPYGAPPLQAETCDRAVQGRVRPALDAVGRPDCLFHATPPRRSSVHPYGHTSGASVEIKPLMRWLKAFLSSIVQRGMEEDEMPTGPQSSTTVHRAPPLVQNAGEKATTKGLWWLIKIQPRKGRRLCLPNDDKHRDGGPNARPFPNHAKDDAATAAKGRPQLRTMGGHPREPPSIMPEDPYIRDN